MPVILGFMEEKKGLAVGIAVACLAIAGVIQFTGQEKDIFPPETGFICVATGEIYWVDPTEATTCPMPNPDTGKRTLLPYEMENGRIYIHTRYRGHIPLLSEVNTHVDPDTFECTLAE